MRLLIAPIHQFTSRARRGAAAMIRHTQLVCFISIKHGLQTQRVCARPAVHAHEAMWKEQTEQQQPVLRRKREEYEFLEQRSQQVEGPWKGGNKSQSGQA